MSKVLVSVFGLFALMGFVGCDGGVETAACVTNDDCVMGYLCEEEICVEKDAVRIVTEELPGATELAPYSVTLEAADGIPPYTWELNAHPDWLSIDEETGELSGDAPQVVSGLVVKVQVTDSSVGRDNNAEVTYELDVEACYEGQQVACYQAEDSACMKGFMLCSGGQWGPCTDLGFSDEMDHCGSECGECDELTADHCQQGVCACGAGSVCADGQGCCDSNCLDVSASEENCGACGVVCVDLILNADGIECLDGACVFEGCSSLFIDCNADLTDGCETAMSAALCGDCDRDCTQITQNVEAIECIDYGDVTDCGYQGYGVDGEGCVFGFLDCDEDRTNGCETEVSNDNCGACELACQTECLVHPETGQYYCGCDDDLDCGDNSQCCSGECVLLSDSHHCGTCGFDCADQMEHVTGMVCDQGQCNYAQCEEFYLDCDGNRTNGCETIESVDNCGSCLFACGDNAACQDHSCMCVADWGNCNDDWGTGCETDLLATIDHCGDCEINCNVQIQNADSGIDCRNGLCDYGSCTGGYGDCDSNRHNGCEEGIWVVGNCGTNCSDTVDCGDTILNASGPYCPDGHCNYEDCLAGWGDCNSSRPDGCETNIWTTSNCGPVCDETINCNTVVQHAGGIHCNDGGECDFDGACSQGWGNCDSDNTDGCETSIWTTANCGQDCTSTVNCNTQVLFASGKSCESGDCDYSSCTSGYMNCNNDRTDGCEEFVWGVTSCGNTCEDTLRPNCQDQVVNANGSEVCSQGTCDYLSCSFGYGNCDDNRSNGCETYLQDNEDHCGDCDIQCVALNGTNTCVTGFCLPACLSHYDDCDDNPNNGCETSIFGSMDNCGECGNRCIPPQVCDTTSCIIPK